MRLNIPKRDLAAGLDAVRHAVPRKSTLPACKRVLFTATEDGTLKLTTTDLDHALTWTGKATVEKPGAVAVPGAELLKLVRSLPNGTITLESFPPTRKPTPSETPPGTLTITAGASSATLETMLADDYPPIPATPEPSALVDGPAFVRDLAYACTAAATEASRPVLHGIMLRLEDDAVTLAAADGFRLAVTRAPALGMDMATWPADRAIIIPLPSADSIVKTLGKQPGDVTLAVGATAKQAHVTRGAVACVTALIEGTFPNYELIIPRVHTTTLTVQADAMLAALQPVAAQASEYSNLVRMTISAEPDAPALTLTSHGARTQAPGTVEGTGLQIGVNARYVRDVLRAAADDGHTMTWQFVNAVSPMVARVNSDRDWLTVVMPMHVRQEAV